MSRDFSDMSDKELMSRFRFLSDNILNIVDEIENKKAEYSELLVEWEEIKQFIEKRFTDVKE